jgi:hypothetical protein
VKPRIDVALWRNRGSVRQALVRVRPTNEIPAAELPRHPPARAGSPINGMPGPDSLEHALARYERGLKSSPLAIKHARL